VSVGNREAATHGADVPGSSLQRAQPGLVQAGDVLQVYGDHAVTGPRFGLDDGAEQTAGRLVKVSGRLQSYLTVGEAIDGNSQRSVCWRSNRRDRAHEAQPLRIPHPRRPDTATTGVCDTAALSPWLA
jgi:hypothetical protein